MMIHCILFIINLSFHYYKSNIPKIQTKISCKLPFEILLVRIFLLFHSFFYSQFYASFIIYSTPLYYLHSSSLSLFASSLPVIYPFFFPLSVLSSSHSILPSSYFFPLLVISPIAHHLTLPYSLFLCSLFCSLFLSYSSPFPLSLLFLPTFHHSLRSFPSSKSIVKEIFLFYFDNGIKWNKRKIPMGL